MPSANSKAQALSPSQDTLRKFSLIAELAQGQRNLTQLAKATGLPEVTVKRQLGALRRDFGMDIQYTRHGGQRGAAGHYQLCDWGVIDRQAFEQRFIVRSPN